MTQVLPAVPNSYSDLLEGYVARARPPRLQAVLTHMETHADPPLTPRRAGQRGVHERPVAARDLPARARPFAHGAPAADPPRPRVHAELLRAGHADERIGDIAVRWASSTRAGSPGNTRTGSASSRPTRPAAPDPAQAGSTQIGDDQATSPSTWNTRA
jgi:hypothetical protein